VECLYVATPPALIAVDLHPIVRLTFLASLTLVAAAMAAGVMIGLAESACTSQDSLWSAVLEERTDVDCSHHGPLSPFGLFYVKAFKETREGGGEIVELNICEQHPMEKHKKFRARASGADRRACAVCDHKGRTDS